MRNLLLDFAAYLSWTWFLFFWPCYPCCGDCEIFADTLSDSVITGWTQTAGSWTETTYIATASSSAKLTCDTTHPDAIPSHFVECDLYGANGDPLRIGVGDHYVELTIGSPNGCLALKTAAGATLTQMRVDAPAATWHLLEVWYGQGAIATEPNFIARLGSAVLAFTVTRNGNSVYLGTGTVGSTVRFRNFVYEKHYATPDDTGCPQMPLDCAIVADTFNRADDSNKGCLWTGSGVISGNRLRFTSTSQTATCQAKHPQNRGAISAAVSFRSSGASDKPRVYASTLDNHYAEFDMGGDTVKIYKAGAECVSSAFTMVANRDYAVVATLSQNAFSVRITDTTDVEQTVCIICALGTPSTSPNVGLGTGGTVTGNVEFDDFTLSRAYDPDNLTCVRICDGCIACDDDTTISAILLKFNPIADGDCNQCNELFDDVEFLLPYLGTNVDGCCGFSLDVDFDCAGFTLVTLFAILCQDSLQVEFSSPVGGVWRSDATGPGAEDFVVDLPVDCDTFFEGRQLQVVSGSELETFCDLDITTVCTIVTVTHG